MAPEAPGVCTIEADQAGNDTYAAATQQISFNVVKAPQTITFAPLPDVALSIGFVFVTASASSFRAVTFTTTTATVCTAGDDGEIDLHSAGTCTVHADQAGTDLVGPAPTVSRSFGVGRSEQAITFNPITDHPVSDSPVMLTASATSLLPVTFSVPNTTTVCSVTGTNVTLTTAGSCSVPADQIGNDSYSAAPSITRTFTVTQESQTITFAVLPGKSVTDPPFTVSATASSLLLIVFTTTTPTVCTASGTTIPILVAGTCTVEADQPGNATFGPADAAFQSFVVSEIDQTITFAALAGRAVAGHVHVAASGGVHGLRRERDARRGRDMHDPGRPGRGHNAQPGAAGAADPRRRQDESDHHVRAVAESRDQPRTCNGRRQFHLDPPGVVHRDDPGRLHGERRERRDDHDRGRGHLHLRADQTGSVTVNAAAPVSRSFAVTKLSQTIAFTAPANTTTAHSPITVTATASSHLVVTFATSTPSVYRAGGMNGAKITLVAGGTCVVRAAQAGNAMFAAAPVVARRFTVGSPVGTASQSGYWMLGSDGRVYAFGSAVNFGSASDSAVALSARHDGAGYWIVDAFGNVHAFGSAAYFGGRPALLSGETVSTISSTPSGKGYWLFTTLGRAFAYGDAHFFGDMRAVHLNGPVVASVATPTGNGYYMVASDGGVFAFGAPFRGSLGSVALNKPVNGLVAFGNGYLMVASDGGVFDFSDKRFVGSLGGNAPSAPIVGIATNGSA